MAREGRGGVAWHGRAWGDAYHGAACVGMPWHRMALRSMIAAQHGVAWLLRACHVPLPLPSTAHTRCQLPAQHPFMTMPSTSQAVDLGLSGLVEAQLGLPLDKALQCSAWGEVRGQEWLHQLRCRASPTSCSCHAMPCHEHAMQLPCHAVAMLLPCHAPPCHAITWLSRSMHAGCGCPIPHHAAPCRAGHGCI